MAVTEMSFATAQRTSRLRVETPARALGLRAGPPKVCARQIDPRVARAEQESEKARVLFRLHSLESHSGVTSEFERVVRPRGSGAANMLAGSLPFYGVSARSPHAAPPAAAPRGWLRGWRLSANPEHRSIGDRFLMCEVAFGDVATFTPEFHMRHKITS